ncbi:hypothetical protein N825_17240 [Skermanella stibiiresistens SB22]|uniref:YgjV family protein n=1 Tax=Skermanella stibiiresistens SB22 TaxID=1385369 RepID=W9GUI7_9PROT|nr:YgjV family protein [Skermanella stibiiresistens]EWY37570.1 hypothetical protein N825_17240 [Skermanella stibiiresistens SB22]
MLADIFGITGVIAGSSWGFLKDRRAILAVQAFATVMFGIHYGLLGAWSGAAMCVMTLVQAASSLPRERNKVTTVLFWSTVPMIALLTILTWNGLASAGAAFGMAMATLGRWQTDTFKLRGFFVLCSLGWGTHNMTVGSPFGLASDTMCLVSNLWRLRGELGVRRIRDEAAIPALPGMAAQA